MPRVAAIGLDAAEWKLIEELFAEGGLPHLSALRRRSAVARLDDPLDHRTGLVWEHFLTGRGAAGNHRWAAVEFDPDTYEVWQEGARPVRPFFATEPPVRSVVFDVPYAPLVFPVDGTVVVGWGGHDPGYPRAAVPKGLLAEIDRRFGPHPAFDNDYEIVWYRPDAIERLCDALVVGARRRADVSLWLLRQFPDWELFVTVLSETHSAGEQLWHGIDADHPVAGTPTAGLAGRRLREVYRAVDDALGRLLAGLPDDTHVVVFSMHGMATNGADVPSMVLLPELLHRLSTGEALLSAPPARDWDADGHPPLVPDTGWTPSVRRSLGPPRSAVKRRLVDARRRLGGVVARARRPEAGGTEVVGALGHRIAPETDRDPAEIGVPRSSVDWQIAMQYRAWWPSMRAFALPTFYDGRIRLNVRGRERDGIVAPEDYERVCDELERELLACRDVRTGRPLVERVDRLRAADPMAPGGPDADLQVVWAGAADALDHPRAGRIGPVPYRRTGGHSARGFAFVAGPGVTPGDLGRRAAADVTPTVLSLLGRPVPADVEGRSLTGDPVGPSPSP
ncbi:MAG: alkaline phosphatase family protein [Acidimicrobiia bacterium]